MGRTRGKRTYRGSNYPGDKSTARPIESMLAELKGIAIATEKADKKERSEHEKSGRNSRR